LAFGRIPAEIERFAWLKGYLKGFSDHSFSYKLPTCNLLSNPFRKLVGLFFFLLLVHFFFYLLPGFLLNALSTLNIINRPVLDIVCEGVRCFCDFSRANIKIWRIACFELRVINSFDKVEVTFFVFVLSIKLVLT
jgi:hypothetical protein